MRSVICLKWHSEMLRWDPSEFNGTDKISLYLPMFAFPDIVQFDGQGSSPSREISLDERVNITSNGTASGCAHVDLVLGCDSFMWLFPKDKHFCSVFIVTGLPSKGLMRLTPRLSSDMSRFNSEVSSKWHVLSVEFRKTDPDQFFNSLILGLEIERRFSLHFFGFVFPVAVSAVLTFIFCWLPLGLSSRMHLVLSAVIVNVLMSISYSESLSESATVPFGLVLSSDLLVFSAFILLLSVVALVMENSATLGFIAMPPKLGQLFDNRMVRKYFIEPGTYHREIITDEIEAETVGGFGTEPNVVESHPDSQIHGPWQASLLLVQRISTIAFLAYYIFELFLSLLRV